MFSGIDSDKPEELQDCLRGKLQKEAIVKNTNDILADEHDFRKELRGSDCVVLVGSGQASFLIQNQQQETEDGLIIFDGKVIHEEFTGNRKLVEKLIMVFFTEKNKNDWIPTGMDEKRIFRLKGEKIWEGNPALDHLEYTIRRVLGETVLDWWKSTASSTDSRRLVLYLYMSTEIKRRTADKKYFNTLFKFKN